MAAHLADLNVGVDDDAPLQSAELLQNTVDQFEKVIDLERTLLRKSIGKLEHDLEEATTELSMKEDDLCLWEEKVQQVQQDNEVKLRIAKSRLESSRFRGRGASIPAHSRASPLGLIVEGDEGDLQEDEDEDEEDDDGAEACGPEVSATVELSGIRCAEADAVNALAAEVAAEVEAIRKQWADLVASTERAKSISVISRRDRLCTQHRIDMLLNERRSELKRLQAKGAGGAASAAATASALGSLVNSQQASDQSLCRAEGESASRPGGGAPLPKGATSPVQTHTLSPQALPVAPSSGSSGASLPAATSPQTPSVGPAAGGYPQSSAMASSVAQSTVVRASATVDRGCASTLHGTDVRSNGVRTQLLHRVSLNPARPSATTTPIMSRGKRS
eukprot:gnl/TRDRNA2_/TRDRNA2_174288_c0_seq1.p1 gnl/TRDRNA2_/TRDRNA2_174288_c0~~gnl/TRDRNA2_/TRDRNA2_174288_c0_seq1.p1  ORF type:complete len:443 (+),score=79.45 gnl/TRDRNA2_/TRDRNA2_174288_c0_seq1:160-1329(+)